MTVIDPYFEMSDDVVPVAFVKHVVGTNNMLQEIGGSLGVAMASVPEVGQVPPDTGNQQQIASLPDRTGAPVPLT